MNVATYDLKSIISDKLLNSAVPFSILPDPIVLESLHNQQMHEEVFKIHQIDVNQFITFSSRQIRLLKVRNGELKSMILPFVMPKKQIASFVQ